MTIITHPAFVPALSVALNLASATRYAIAKDPARATYWLAAAALTATVTWWMKT